MRSRHQSASVVFCDLSVCKTKEPRSIVVEDVALLSSGQERRLLDNRDCGFDDVWPVPLVRTKHHACTEAGIHELAKLLVEIYAG
jgi:hypothetical protein